MAIERGQLRKWREEGIPFLVLDPVPWPGLGGTQPQGLWRVLELGETLLTEERHIERSSEVLDETG